MTDFMEQPLGLLCEVTRRELIHLLESLPGQKEMVVDPSLLRPLDRVGSMSLLKRHGCERVLPLRPDTSHWGSSANIRRVYILRATLENANLAAEHFRANPDKKLSVIWVDRRVPMCETKLEEHGLVGLVDSFEMSMCLIPIETDLFSLELPVSHTLDYYAMAHSLFQLQSLYGLIPTIRGIGEHSEKTWRLVKHLYADRGEPRASPDQPISHLFLFDRQVDVATVLLTALTYEAMLHDEFQIGCGKIAFGDDVEARMKTDKDSTERRGPRLYVLDNNDGVFASVRNKHITGVFPFLSAKAKDLQFTYNKGSSIDQVRDMKEFVSNELKHLRAQHRQLEMHICACEVLLERGATAGAAELLQHEHQLVNGTADLTEVFSYVEDCILREQSAWKVLALACLASLTQNGLPPKHFHSFREHFLRGYGYEYLPVLHTLMTKRLLTEKTKPVIAAGSFVGKSSPQMGGANSNDHLVTFPFLAKRLALVPSSSEPPIDLKQPLTMNYVFGGAYTPLFCQIVADTMTQGWNTNEQKKTFNGRVFVEENSYTPADGRPDKRIQQTILVYFIGGVTYAEVAALRHFAVHNNVRILIAASQILNRETWLQAQAEVVAHDPVQIARI